MCCPIACAHAQQPLGHLPRWRYADVAVAAAAPGGSDRAARRRTMGHNQAAVWRLSRRCSVWPTPLAPSPTHLRSRANGRLQSGTASIDVVDGAPWQPAGPPSGGRVHIRLQAGLGGPCHGPTFVRSPPSHLQRRGEIVCRQRGRHAPRGQSGVGHACTMATACTHACRDRGRGRRRPACASGACGRVPPARHMPGEAAAGPARRTVHMAGCRGPACQGVWKACPQMVHGKL